MLWEASPDADFGWQADTGLDAAIGFGRSLPQLFLHPPG